ncbi:sigma-70 family RNA polymerase sigma factor [Saccharibacillus sp. CPCC 101409]|uniref:sigma-70 family RNA polymerase sigma factor n=1 Tax=Saccharibacillus sp. CPCC 101409 TaxID=3058041 RepID=UPI002672F30E|nr:sigma-70 family RNA polymerase sigma factor [Saccharibacillus sp. CPCC 101409]MDO3409929.1 sigma-70 family RNA polymerase sigma factor [Saccharibacillus sp. CPCC 101409]
MGEHSGRTKKDVRRPEAGESGSAEAVGLARLGRAEAWNEIVRRYGGMAVAVAYGRLRDMHLAEDAAQEAFAEAYANLHRLGDDEAFPGWFKVIVQRRASRLTRRKRLPSLGLEAAGEVADEAPRPEAVAERRELRRALYESVEQLPAGQRDAVRLFYFEGCSLREMSGYLGATESALKKRLFDARARLRSALPVADFAAAFRDLYEGGTGMLHIVNGDHAAERLREAGIEGEVLVWRELYPFGPAYPDMEEASARLGRAEYMERELGIPRAQWLRGCADQERALRGAAEYGEIVLWFEHDLFDQTMLALLLDRLGRMRLGEARLSLLCIGAYPGVEDFRGLGQLTAGQIGTLSGTWQPVGRRELDLGARLWAAYSSPDPQEHLRFLSEDSSALPFARAAFEAHLARIPSAADGLGAIERAVLEAAADGAASPRELFAAAGSRLSLLGLGDLEFWRHLERMTAGPAPLLRMEGAAAFPNFVRMPPDFGRSVFAPTDLGRRALEGAVGPGEAGGALDWAGGLRLRGEGAVLRRDAETGEIRPVREA